MRGPVLIAAFALLRASVVMLGMLGSIDRIVDFSSVLQIWSDVFRDVDQFGLSLMRLSSAREMDVGRQVVAS